jgi:hypothetical protein
MKFITEDGKVVEGTAITDRQAELLNRFEAYLHRKVCDHTYHGSYGKKPCRETAHEIVPKLDDSAAGALLSAIFEPELEAIPEPAPEPKPQPVAVKNDDMPF